MPAEIVFDRREDSSVTIANVESKGTQMEPCTTHHEHCWCRVIPFVVSVGAGIAMTIIAIAKWKKISSLLCSRIKAEEK
jgi:hypothetical protein